MDNPTTTLTFTEAQLQRLVDCKALDRVTRKPGRTKSERVHLPKIEALLNELL